MVTLTMGGSGKIVIRVREVRGQCPIFTPGDTITIDGAELDMKATDAYCVWASASFLPYLVAARYGVPADEIGLGTAPTQPYVVQCLDPGPPLTPGGTVVFEIRRE